MKRSVIIAGFFIIIIFAAISVQAQTVNSSEEQQKVSKAYSCLQAEVSENCGSLSTEEKIFSFLSIGQCQSELLSDSSNNGECWPKGDCDVKTTAQAALALDNANINTAKAQAWLLSQAETPTELLWYLEIESSEPTSCAITYDGTSRNINIGADKKISNNAGQCLVLAQDDYWLNIAPNCFDKTFEISCDKGFLTSLLFRKIGSSTIHVSEDSSSASSGGTTREKVESSCFFQDGQCTYDGSLWTSLILDSLEEDISSFLPYLITVAEDNRIFLPDSFLYLITGDSSYRDSLISMQKSSQWWVESGDRYYDTALALYPFQDESDFEEKTNSKEWLLDSQDSDGCWGGEKVRNTAFILASVWPKSVSGGGGAPDCENAGYFCSSRSTCGGEILSEYDCPGALSVCCSTEPQLETCSEKGGIICGSGQTCENGIRTRTADSDSCCVGDRASCINVQVSECEQFNGICRTSGCNDNEESSFYSCQSGEFCCVQKQSNGGYAWIWILVILIILVVVGIIFRDKLRIFWVRLRSKFGRRKSGGPSGPPSHGPPRGSPPRAFQERRILLPSGPPPQARPSPRKSPSRAQKELDDVLKKLKDMSK